MRWIQVAPADTIPPRQGREVHVGDLSVAVFNAGGRYLALENRCPHSGDPLADGTVIDTTVTCGLHHWRICLETGLVIKPCIEGTPQVRTFPVEVRDGVGLPSGLDFRNTESLGLQLVNTLTSQLGGAIILDQSEGTRFSITFPS